MVSADHSAARDADFHSAAGMMDATSSSCDSIDWVVSGTSAGSLAEGWCTDKNYS